MTDQENGEIGQNDMLEQLGWKFESREELMDTLRQFFAMQGYAISIKTSTKGRYITLGCDRGGCYRNKWHVPMERRQRNTATRLINCPFEIRCKRLDDGFWVLEVKNGSHNHEPSSDMAGHPSFRRFSKEEIMTIEELTRSGVPPRQILSSLRLRNKKLQAVSRTIYNMKNKLRRENLAGRTTIQALFDELCEGDFTFQVAYDQNGCLTHLFIAHPLSITLTKSYTTVFVMDCTYKTNRYKMPLLDIIGVSSFNKSFYSCFAFLEKEGEEDYAWALRMFSNLLGPSCQPSVIVSDRELALMNAIKVVFPTTTNLLCVWHIEKNILTNCKPRFARQEDWTTFLSIWNQVISSQNEELFEQAWNFFELLYKEKQEVLSYIRRTWLPFKEKFVKGWTDKCLHFGNRASSRAEGAHSKLKKYLLVSTGDLQEVKNKICLAIENEFNEIKTQLLSERIRVPHRSNILFFKELVSHVSVFAMGELLKQYEMMRHGTMQSICTGHFMASMGLPCAHKMIEWKDKILPLDAIHSQWRIDIRSLSVSNGEQDGNSAAPKESAQGSISQLEHPSFPMLFEPTIQVHKGRPPTSRKGKETSSTKRNSSQFEIIDAPRKCSICKAVGHNSRTCRDKLGPSVINPSYGVGIAYEGSTMDEADINTIPISTECFWLDG
ncbi:hypothetical protein RHGRI_009772 [Rhododendron griersonianum]|uniref:MULE transposase domain-containing protein n=1 Tax=Rhododendron griersonianum TaxID=479676 RepID=A0AAV6KGP2_9ERIC|nr:hypothetical protein RHGRI_009772 [Rhododendron griersonianum]